MAAYQIIPLKLSEPINVAPAAFYYKAYSGDMRQLIYGCFAVKNKDTGEIIMVDTGLASQEDIAKYNYPFRKMPGAPSLKEVLADHEIDPLHVQSVIFTHLHQDHCFNLELFQNAKFYVQKSELQHAATPTPIESKSYQKYDLPGLPAWARVFGRMITIDGDFELQDGITLLLTPGHTPGSQTVIVNSESGPYYLVGDNFYDVEQFETGKMNGNFTNLEDWYQVRLRIQQLIKKNGGKILCVHDPHVYEREIYG